MGRPRRVALGGYVYHVLNRANARLPIFRKDSDYEAFEQVMAEALGHVPGMRLLAYCLMPNHWHLVLWPRRNGELSDFGHWLTLTHTQRWHAQHRNIGNGHLYQGRFKSFPVAQDEHFLSVCRYVERNPVRAQLTPRAENWRWGSLWRRRQADVSLQAILSDWPINRSKDWLVRVNKAETDAELNLLRASVQRGRPFGAEAWQKRTVVKLDLASTMRPRGRPKKAP